MAVWTDQALYDRLWEMACRANAHTMPVFTRFLTPPEGDLALALGKKAGVEASVWGGYPDAERRMCCFSTTREEKQYPFSCLEITWAGKFAATPQHRDILGSVMGLGIERSFIGDIIVAEKSACLFATTQMGTLIEQALISAGQTKITARVLARAPGILVEQGEPFADTVASLRLDSVLASGLQTSRAKAADIIRQGRVLVNHQETDRIDRMLLENDVISVRGAGRMRVEKVGAPTRKDRLPLVLRRFGIKG